MLTSLTTIYLQSSVMPSSVDAGLVVGPFPALGPTKKLLPIDHNIFVG